MKTHITELNDLSIKLEELEYNITDKHFMIKVLNNMTSDCVLNMTIMEKPKPMNDKVNLLIIADVMNFLNLHFESLNMKANEYN
jgi:hypothetical protein